MDYSEVFAGLSISPAVAGILGAGAILALPPFARWLVEKVSSFFQDTEDGDEDEAWTPCAGECGNEYARHKLDEDGFCAECHHYSKDD